MSQSRQHFSELEKSLLTELLGKDKNVLEKDDGLGTLAAEFNSQAGVNKRDSKKLKRCWEKSRAKKVSLRRREKEAKLLGGGTGSAEKHESATDVASIIPAQMPRLENTFADGNYQPGKGIATK